MDVEANPRVDALITTDSGVEVGLALVCTVSGIVLLVCTTLY